MHLTVDCFIPILDKKLKTLGFKTKRQKQIEDVLKEQFGEDEVEFIQTFNSYRAKEAFAADLSLSGLNTLYIGKYLCNCPSEYIIHKPETVVTNENGKYTTVYDLFIRIFQDSSGYSYPCISYKKPTFTRGQWNIGYVHSHCPQIYDTSTPEICSWRDVCLGSGDINNTIRRIATPNFNYYDWKVFAMQIDQITRVESLAGGPYITLEHINTGAIKVHTLSPNKFSAESNSFKLSTASSAFKQFLLSYIKSGRFKVVYGGRSYVCGMCFTDWLEDITEYYLKWKELAIKELKPIPLLPVSRYYCIKNKGLYIPLNDRNRDVPNINIITFKGKDYPLTVLEDTQNRYEGQPLIEPGTGLSILNSLLETINFRMNQCHETYRKEDRPKRKAYCILPNAAIFVE